MAWSQDEERMLLQIERHLIDEDPRLVARLESFNERVQRREGGRRKRDAKKAIKTGGAAVRQTPPPIDDHHHVQLAADRDTDRHAPRHGPAPRGGGPPAVTGWPPLPPGRR